MDEPFGGLIEAFGQDTWPADFLIGLVTLMFIIAAYVVLRYAARAVARKPEPDESGLNSGDQGGDPMPRKGRDMTIERDLGF